LCPRGLRTRVSRSSARPITTLHCNPETRNEHRVVSCFRGDRSVAPSPFRARNTHRPGTREVHRPSSDASFGVRYSQVCLTWHLPPSRFDLLGSLLLRTPSTHVDHRSWGSKLTVSNWRPCSARVSAASKGLQTTGVGGSTCKQLENALPWVTRAAIHPFGDQSLDTPTMSHSPMSQRGIIERRVHVAAT